MAEKKSINYKSMTSEELVKVMAGPSRISRKNAAKYLLGYVKEDPKAHKEYIPDFIDALSRPEAQTRWQALDCLTYLVDIDPKSCKDAVEQVEEALFDDRSGLVRESAVRFLCHYGATSKVRSKEVWPLIKEALQQNHGELDFDKILGYINFYAAGKINDDIKKELRAVVKDIANSVSGPTKKRLDIILSTLRKRPTKKSTSVKKATTSKNTSANNSTVAKKGTVKKGTTTKKPTTSKKSGPSKKTTTVKKTATTKKTTTAKKTAPTKKTTAAKKSSSAKTSGAVKKPASTKTKSKEVKTTTAKKSTTRNTATKKTPSKTSAKKTTSKIASTAKKTAARKPTSKKATSKSGSKAGAKKTTARKSTTTKKSTSKPKESKDDSSGKASDVLSTTNKKDVSKNNSSINIAIDSPKQKKKTSVTQAFKQAILGKFSKKKKNK